MFEDLKNLFSKTWTAFHEEASRRDPEDQIAELLAAMRREMVEARAALPLLDEAVTRTRAELDRERQALADVQRRRGLAERIGDAETVRVADEFAERHTRRIAVLEEKVRSAQAERDLQADEIQRMSRQYKEADANRFALLAQLRTQRAKGTMGSALGGSSAPSDDFGRMSDRIDQDTRYAEALDDLADLDAPPPPGPSRPSASEIEERLNEIKRRMGQA